MIAFSRGRPSNNFVQRSGACEFLMLLSVFGARGPLRLMLGILQMRYFTYDLIASANDWITQSEIALRKAEKQLQSVLEEYFRQLDTLEHRISRAAWQFFRYGFGSKSLHDGRLLSLRVGDGLSYRPDGSFPFFLNKERTSAIIEFLNYEQDLHYVFDLRGVDRLCAELFGEEESPLKSVGDLYTYELTDGGNNKLRLGFLFASGASIVVEFKRIVFRKKRIARGYDVGAMYRF